MIEPELPINENQRQAAVERYNILDTPEEANFDNITALMSQVMEVPICLITLLDKDRNYLKSHYGIPFSESPRNISFCGHAINTKSAVTIVEDASQDERFSDNPLVTDAGVRFYAGAPLVTPDGYRLGTLCLFDVQPKKLDAKQIEVLMNMAKQVEALLDLRYQNLLLLESQQEMKEINEGLERFAGVVTHDIKSPLTKLSYAAQILADDFEHIMDTDAARILGIVKSSAGAVGKYIDELSAYYTSDRLLSENTEAVDLNELYTDIKAIAIRDEAQLIVDHENKAINVNRAVLSQILVNLFTNSIKYNDKSSKKIWIKFESNSNQYFFNIKDNGIGIPENQISTIFEMFTTCDRKSTGNVDCDGQVGTGLGLAMVAKLVNQSGGEITVNSDEGVGSEFVFSLHKYPQPKVLNQRNS